VQGCLGGCLGGSGVTGKYCFAVLLYDSRVRLYEIIQDTLLSALDAQVFVCAKLQTPAHACKYICMRHPVRCEANQATHPRTQYGCRRLLSRQSLWLKSDFKAASDFLRPIQCLQRDVLQMWCDTATPN